MASSPQTRKLPGLVAEPPRHAHLEARVCHVARRSMLMLQQGPSRVCLASYLGGSLREGADTTQLEPLCRMGEEPLARAP